MPTIATKLQALISEQIISGRYAPGAKLDERTLADEFNVSRTPVREALRQLASRGLTEIVPMRGVVVKSISVKELSEILHADCELEALCARLSAESMSAMEKTELQYVHLRSQEHVKNGDLDGYLEANRELHRLILEGAHNDVLSVMVGDIRERLSPYRQYHPAESDRLESSHTSHNEIVQAILDGDGEKAYLAMRNHNAHLGNAALRAVRQARESAAPSSTSLPVRPRTRQVETEPATKVDASEQGVKRTRARKTKAVVNGSA